MQIDKISPTSDFFPEKTISRFNAHTKKISYHCIRNKYLFDIFHITYVKNIYIENYCMEILV